MKRGLHNGELIRVCKNSKKTLLVAGIVGKQQKADIEWRDKTAGEPDPGQKKEQHGTKRFMI